MIQRSSLEMMGQLMCMQIRLLIKPLITPLERTYKWLLSSVNPHMSLEVEIKGKSLVTKLTFVWFLTLLNNELEIILNEKCTYSVNEHVSLQFGIIQESLTASFVRALEQLIPVNCVVFLQ